MVYSRFWNIYFYSKNFANIHRLILHVDIKHLVFQIFWSPIELNSDNAESVTTTCVDLHDFFLGRKKRSRTLYTPPETYDNKDSEFNVINGSWRN